MGHGYAKSKPMPTERDASQPAAMQAAPKPTPAGRPLSPAAERALAEAAARHAERERNAATAPKERNGPAGPDPTRYGDWEINGIASDF
jgi:hypothetical protein